jgi:hypothetical protein
MKGLAHVSAANTSLQAASTRQSALKQGQAADRFLRATTLVRADVYDPVSGLVIPIWTGAVPNPAPRTAKL